MLFIFSLINVSDGIATIHRLVQMAVNSKIVKASNFDLLFNYWNVFDENIYNRCEMRHILSIWKHSAKHESLVNRYCCVCDRIYQRLSFFSMVHEQFVFASDNYRQLCQTLGYEHTESLAMEGHLAHAMFEKGLNHIPVKRFI